MFYEYYIMGVILIPGIIFSIYAQLKVNSNFTKYHSYIAECGRTAAEVARIFLDNAGLQNIQIVRINGHLTDHYNHRTKTIGLSESVYDSTSIAAIGIACHEVGHALQYKTNYPPIRIRNLMIPICNFANRFIWILIILGALFVYSNLGTTFLWIGVGIFALSVLLNLVTLPVEYNASRRATQVLYKSTILTQEETQCTKEVLNAAALTYVAALVVSMLNLLRLLLIVGRRSNRD